MQINPIISGWSYCIPLSSCRGMSSREVTRCLDKLRARGRIEWKSVADEIGERCRGCYILDLDKELREYSQAEECTNKISCHAVASCV